MNDDFNTNFDYHLFDSVKLINSIKEKKKLMSLDLKS